MKTTLTLSLISVLLLSGLGLDNFAYAESPKLLFEKAKLEAEIQFAEIVSKAKSNQQKITSDPNLDSDVKLEAKQAYKKLVTEVKNIRDKTIVGAQDIYLTVQPIALTEVKQQLTEKINDAKMTHESTLNQAKLEFQEAMSSVKDKAHQKLIKQDYDATLSQLTKTYNDAISKAKTEYDLVKNLLGKGGVDNV